MPSLMTHEVAVVHLNVRGSLTVEGLPPDGAPPHADHRVVLHGYAAVMERSRVSLGFDDGGLGRKRHGAIMGRRR